MNYIIELSINILEAYIWIKTTNLFLTSKYRKKFYYCSMIMAWVLLSLKSILSLNYGGGIVPIIAFIVCILFMGGCTFAMYSNPIMDKLFIFLAYLCGTATIELIIIGILYYSLPGIEIETFTSNTIYRYGTSIMGLSFIFLILEIIKSKKAVVLQIENKIRNMIIGIILVDSMLFFIVYIFFNQVQYLSSDAIIIFIGVIVIIITLYSIFIISRLYKSADEAMVHQLKVQNMEMKLKLNMDMSIVINNLRSLKHDISNHLTIINGLLNTNQINSLNKYLDGLLQEVYAANDFIMIDNEALCIILNNKKAVAIQKGIDFECSITTNMSKFSDIETCSLFGNLLDNAIEATDKLEDHKYIDFKIYKNQTNFVIECTNPCKEVPVIKNNKIVTTKDDKRIHGIGIKNIYDIVNKYNGQVNYLFTDKTCNVRICVPLS